MTNGDERHLSSQLRRHGLRVTGQRLAVARCLLETDSHLTADGILKRLRAKGCRCARATLYNVLNDFLRCGLIQRVNVDGAGTYFDPVTEPHPHLYIRETSELFDLPVNALPDEAAIELPEDLELTGVSLVIHARRRAGDVGPSDGIPRVGSNSFDAIA